MRAAGLIVLIAAAPGAFLAPGRVTAQSLPPPPYASEGAGGGAVGGSPTAYTGANGYGALDRYGGGRRADPTAAPSASPASAGGGPAGGAPAFAYLSWSGKAPMQAQAAAGQTGGWSGMARQWDGRPTPARAAEPWDAQPTPKPRFRLPWSRQPQAPPVQAQQAVRPQDMAPPVRPWTRVQDRESGENQGTAQNQGMAQNQGDQNQGAQTQGMGQNQAVGQERAFNQTPAEPSGSSVWRPLYPQAPAAPAPTSIYDPVPAASQPVQPPPPRQAPAYSQAQTGDATGPRFYSLHREYGIQPDAIPLPPQFFGPTADLSTPPAEPQVRRAAGQTRTTAAPETSDAGQ